MLTISVTARSLLRLRLPAHHHELGQVIIIIIIIIIIIVIFIRSLWLRFVSDGTIEYSGFRAVYEYVLNPMEIIPFIPKCEFEIGGAMDFIGKIWSMNKIFYLHVFGTTKFYQLKDLLLSVDYSSVYKRSFGKEKLWGFVLCLWRDNSSCLRKVEQG